jgi:hypothetical protein
VITANTRLITVERKWQVERDVILWSDRRGVRQPEAGSHHANNRARLAINSQ